MGYRISVLLVLVAIIAIQAADRPPCKGLPDGKFVKDPSTCRSWFACSNEKETPGTCASGYFFDLRSGGCNYEEKVECVDDTNKDGLCKGVPESTFLKNPKACNAYFVCVSGKAIEGFCPNDLQFNPATQECDTAAIVGCEEYEPTDPGQYACKNVPDYTFVENDVNCKGYYSCMNEKGKPLDCDDDFLFNKQTGACDYKENVKCNTPGRDVCKDAKNGEFVADPLSCRRYYQCFTGQEPRSGTCPNNHKYFNTNSKSCSANIANCNISPEQVCEGEKPGSFLPNPQDCKGYYICNATPEPKQCPDDLQFNPAKRECDYEENVKCDL